MSSFRLRAISISLLTGMAFISSIALEIKDVMAEVPSCIELSNPRIGSTCYTEVPYNVRVEHSKSQIPFEIPQVAIPGYVIIDTRDFQESRIGTTEGPSVIITRPGTALQIRQSYQQAYKDFNDFIAGVTNINSGAMLEIKQRTEEQFNNAINELTRIQSNSEAIVIKGSAQCQWRTWLGVTEWTSGGTLRGGIRVYQRYVGIPEQASQILSSAKNKILSLVGENSGSTPNVIPTESGNTSGSTCVSVDSRRGWQRFKLPGSFTKVVSISGGWSVDSRSHASVGASGHSGRDAEDLAPYNQYKYDQGFPFGALLMGSGQGVLWIQNPKSFNSSPFGAVDMRINDADNALSDNGGSLQVCFGN